MNIFDKYLEIIYKLIKDESDKGKLILPHKLNSITVEIPPEKFDSDLSTNVAMVLGKINKKPPLILAEQIKKRLSEVLDINEIKIVKPGFINIKLKNDYWGLFTKDILSNSKDFGVNLKEKKISYLIEFVSANPTGPLHVGHCRGAILGDVLSNLLIFNKHNVTKEYYVNDYGNQILFFTKSVFLRIREILFKEPFPFDNPDLYPGDYLIEISNNIINNNSKLKFDNFETVSEKLTEISVNESLKIIKNNLNNLGIKHDNFVSEKSIVSNKEVDKVIKKLKQKNLLYKGTISAPERKQSNDYKIREQTLFKSTEFGDDKDRALQKSDNTWTYFASDAAYHNNKVERNFDKLINILGSDHTGYVKRITSLVEALSNNKDKLVCKVSQLVKLIKDGKPFKMSKRKGDYITVEDLISEVGKDATRFIMLNRSSDVELDFDFEKVKEKTKDNPIYYVQYCYARISSVYRKLNKNIDDTININSNLNFGVEEIKVLRKISEWPKCVEISCNKLEPHRITTYLYELASEFHYYWNLGKNDESKRFIINNSIELEKLVFLKVVSLVIKSGMNILGVETPEEM
jgi:arginyl-tRNA synthetase